jgi:hypothetical protein
VELILGIVTTFGCWAALFAIIFAYWLVLSRFCAAPSARLCRLPFESDRAFPA